MPLVWIFLSLLIPLLGFILSPTLTRAILGDLRLIRILHYVSLTCLGLVLYYDKENFSSLFQVTMIMKLLLFILALTYAAVFAIISNNIADLETDKISNPERPLVQQTVEIKSYLRAGIFCLIYALILSFFIEKAAFWGIIGISVGYYLYSCEPFRLKKIPFLAKLFIGINSWVVALTGFVLAGGMWNEFPRIWIFYILVPLSLSANFIDLKDIEGDRAMQVKTLPVLWGELPAKHFIAVMTAFSYFIPAYLLGIIFLYPVVFVLFLAHIYFLYAKPYREKPIFFLYVSSIFGLNLFLFVSKFWNL